ncbi:MAG: M48 family metalloprotease [Magnetococcales bacterium]|nr:M48 family metalloprotease [Magnetococcales bacterium]
MKILNKIAILVGLIFISSCAVNPVTGERELALITKSQELSIGKKQYGPSRQSQGGDYTADPKLVAYVQEVGQRLAKVSDRKLPYEFVVINSPVPNAWALPGGKIAINRGLLLELKSEGELAAVLGHEIVHAAARHSARGMERGMLLQGVTMAAGVAIKNSSYAEYSDLAIKGTGLASNLLNHKYGRDAERESDHFGIIYMERAGYDPKAAIDLQETFVRLSKSGDSNWLAGLFASHPPSQERVENNKKDVAALKKGGELGVERYEKMLAHLRKVQPAYKAYEEGLLAFNKKEYAKAKKLAKKAIKIEPKEGLFLALLGDIQTKQGENLLASTSYNRAVKANPDFFLFYEKRGKLREKLGDSTGFRKDMIKGAKLFPTVNSYLALGHFAKEDGNKKLAVKYFRQAAQSDSKNGRKAANALVRLDLSDNPSHYLKAHFVLSKDGRLFVTVKNPTNVAVAMIGVTVFYNDSLGRKRAIPLEINEGIAPGKSKTVSSGIASIDGQSLRQRGFQVIVDKAEVYTN